MHGVAFGIHTLCDIFSLEERMIKRLIFILLPLVVMAQENYNGLGDTAYILDTLQTDTLKYTKVFLLSANENLRVIIKTDDTSTAGFASDSIAFDFGYQTGEVVYNSAGTRDTAWDDRMQIDSMVGDSFGVANVGTTDADAVLTRYYGGVDTSSVSGFAIKSRLIVPEWGTLIRFWAKGRPTNRKGKILLLCFDLKRRQYSNVRSK